MLPRQLFILPQQQALPQRQAAQQQLLPQQVQLQEQESLRQQQAVQRVVIPILVHSYVSSFLENSNYN